MIDPTTHQDLLNRIAHGEIQQVIETLLSRKDLPEDRRKELIAISARYERLQSDRRKGLITHQEEKITENKIVASLLELIGLPEEEEDDEPGIWIRWKQPIKLFTAIVGTAIVIIGISFGASKIFPTNSNGTNDSLLTQDTCTDTPFVPVAGKEGADQPNINPTIPENLVNTKFAKEPKVTTRDIDTTQFTPPKDTVIPKPHTITGQIDVMDSPNFPKTGFRVLLLCNGQLIQEKATNASGDFSFSIPDKSTLSNYRIHAEGNGCKPSRNFRIFEMDPVKILMVKEK
jgi:hypothetical protein